MCYSVTTFDHILLTKQSKILGKNSSENKNIKNISVHAKTNERKFFKKTR